MRRVNYRHAAIGFVFTSLWFIFGIILLWTPIPSSLGIRGTFFVAWLMLFFLILAGAGATLILASVNGAFPPQRPGTRRDAVAARASAIARATAARGTSGGANSGQRS